MSTWESTSRRQRTADRDWLYFCENACLTSFSGCVDDDSTMTEQAISEYILYSNPTLHAKLNGIRIPSSYLPSDDTPSERDRPVSQPQHNNTSELVVPTSAGEQSEETAEASGSVSANNVVLPTVTNAEGQTTEFVLDRYHFTLRRHSDPTTTYCCSYAECPTPMNVIPVGEYYGSVTDEAGRQNQPFFPVHPRTVYYCFDCLKLVLKQEFDVQMAHQVPPQLVDGSLDRETLLKSAEKMHPALDPNKLKWMYFPQEPPLSPGTDSNSKRATRLRRQKQYEIIRILEDLEQNAARKEEYIMTVEGSDVESLDLHIYARRDLSPYRDRYKKQGLQYHELYNQYGTVEPPEAYGHAPPDDDAVSEDKIAFSCFCREPDDDAGMIHCSSPSCMFGAIHLRCSGLDDVTSITEEFLCQYCQPDGGACSDNDCSDNTVETWVFCQSPEYELLDSGVSEDEDETGEGDDTDASAELEGDDVNPIAGADPVPTQSSGFTAING